MLVCIDILLGLVKENEEARFLAKYLLLLKVLKYVFKKNIFYCYFVLIAVVRDFLLVVGLIIFI